MSIELGQEDGGELIRWTFGPTWASAGWSIELYAFFWMPCLKRTLTDWNIQRRQSGKGSVYKSRHMRNG